jgi:hypothetical protein
MHEKRAIVNVQYPESVEMPNVVHDRPAVALVAGVDDHVANDVILVDANYVDRADVTPDLSYRRGESAELAGVVRYLAPEREAVAGIGVSCHW